MYKKVSEYVPFNFNLLKQQMAMFLFSNNKLSRWSFIFYLAFKLKAAGFGLRNHSTDRPIAVAKVSKYTWLFVEGC